MKHSDLLEGGVAVPIRKSKLLMSAEFIMYIYSSTTALLINSPGNRRKVLKKEHLAHKIQEHIVSQ